jgi:L1 cell adhesion molecule like protein
LLFKNENLNDEMVEILDELHNKYVPLKKVNPGLEDGDTEVHKAVFFGGDQLTEERARNSQNSRGEGDTTYERLEGLIPKVEDWHAIRLVYQVQ